MKKTILLSTFFLLFAGCAKEEKISFEPTAMETFIALFKDKWYLFAAALVLIIAAHFLLNCRKKCCANSADTAEHGDMKKMGEEIEQLADRCEAVEADEVAEEIAEAIKKD